MTSLEKGERGQEMQEICRQFGPEAIYRALDLRRVDLFAAHAAAAGVRSSGLRKASANQKICDIHKSVKSIHPGVLIKLPLATWVVRLNGLWNSQKTFYNTSFTT